MVTSTRCAQHYRIIASPNCSASWRSNKLALVFLSIPSLLIATGFLLLGAWPILPFAGLELLALGSSLYYVSWKLQYRHVITFSGDSVRIEKGCYAPRRSWQFPRRRTGLAISPEQHPWDGPGLCLHDSSDRVPVGDFLGRDEALKLAELLRREVRVSTHSAEHRQPF